MRWFPSLLLFTACDDLEGVGNNPATEGDPSSQTDNPTTNPPPPTTPAPADTVLVTFDEPEPPSFVPFGGLAASIVADPADATNQVAELVKAARAEPWAGTVVSTCEFDSVAGLPFTKTDTTMSVRVWAPDAGLPIRLKVENRSDPTQYVDTETATTVAQAWETLVFDLDDEVPSTPALNLAHTYDRVSVLPDFGSAGSASTFYIDDITFLGKVFDTDCPPPPDPETWPLTFDDESTTYTLAGFAGLETSLVADPDDADNTVMEAVKPSTAQAWSGVTVSTLPDATVTPAPVRTTDDTMTMRVRASVANAVVRIKIEDASDNQVFVEAEATATAADTWQTLSFDFGSPVGGTIDDAATYDRITIFPQSEGTYLFDDIGMGSLTPSIGRSRR